MTGKCSVLVVDQLEETREVLRTVLERRGVQIFDAQRADRGLELARQHHPDVIVLDTEMQTADPAGVSAEFEKEAQLRQTPMVLLGNVRRQSNGCATQEFVRKPYHYGPLVRKIEQLLTEQQLSTERSRG